MSLTHHLARVKCIILRSYLKYAYKIGSKHCLQDSKNKPNANYREQKKGKVDMKVTILKQGANEIT